MSAEMQKAIIDELPRFVSGQADQYTLLGAIRLQEDIRVTQALLALIHRGELVAEPFEGDVDVNDIQWRKS